MQSKGPGLSGLVSGVLGQALDKRLQCSTWGLRPLSQQQVWSHHESSSKTTSLKGFNCLAPNSADVPRSEARHVAARKSYHKTPLSLPCKHKLKESIRSLLDILHQAQFYLHCRAGSTWPGCPAGGIRSVGCCLPTWLAGKLHTAVPAFHSSRHSL